MLRGPKWVSITNHKSIKTITKLCSLLAVNTSRVQPIFTEEDLFHNHSKSESSEGEDSILEDWRLSVDKSKSNAGNKKPRSERNFTDQSSVELSSPTITDTVTEPFPQTKSSFRSNKLRNCQRRVAFSNVCDKVEAEIPETVPKDKISGLEKDLPKVGQISQQFKWQLTNRALFR